MRTNEAIGASRPQRQRDRKKEIRMALVANDGGVSAKQRALRVRALREARSAAGGIGDGRPGYQTLPRRFPEQGGPMLPGRGPKPQRPMRPGRGLGRVEPGGVAGLGHQLTRRISAGTIDQSRATQTAVDRSALAEMLGPNWRVKAFGDRGYMRRTREALAKEPQNPELQALYTALMERRDKLLKRARQEQSGGNGAIGGAVPAA